MGNTNSNLHAAKAAKNDEFYTRLEDIENELRHYRHHFKGKTILCNCDDPRVSNFFRYFALNFETFGLKKLIATCYKNQNADLFSQHDCENAVYIVYEGDRNGNGVPDLSEIEVKPLNGDGDFKSEECVRLLEEADIVATNPPFSHFREYIGQLMKYDKKFVVIGNIGAASYKEIFPLIKENKLWLGYHSGHTLFAVPETASIPDFYDKNDKSKLRSNGYIIDKNGRLWRNLGNICWFTNLDIPKRHEDLILYKHYTPEEYSKYDNYDAIDVSKVADIPCDYNGVMGVPISFLDKYNPEQFEIIGLGTGDSAKILGIGKNYRGRTDLSFTKNGVHSCPYGRILIRKKYDS